jgi:hypothetical protein
MSHVGTNLQQMPKQVKTCFIPPSEDYLFGEVDLAGADLWTVAALCKSLGDPTLYEDMLAGVKGQWIPLIGFMDGLDAVNQSQECLKKRGKELAEERPDLYKGAKAATHGSNYLVKPNKGVEILLKQSQGEVLMNPKDFALLQDAYHHRYRGVKVWQEDTRQRLMKEGWLRGAGGHRRRFFDRRSSEDTLRVALSELPQQNTTLATNLALENLFYGDFNRDSRGHLKVFPCHTVHDSIIFWVLKKWVPYAGAILKEAFNNPLRIGSEVVTIDFEWELGLSWGHKFNREELETYTR